MLEIDQFGESNWRGPRRRKPPFYKRFWFRAIFTLIILSVVGTWAGWKLIVEPLREKAETFDLEEIKKLEVASIIYDRNGGELGRMFILNRTPIALSDVPKHFQDALVAQEDSRFYDHHGVDFYGVLRAVVWNLRQGEQNQGASTITQQLARQAFSLLERSYKRKILEMYLAYRVDRYYTKSEIMELYLNRIFFGSGNGQNFYGVQAAARGYFGKDAKDLTLEESATLVGLIKSPNKLSPLRNPKGSLISRNHVLDRMVGEGFITHERASEAQTTPMVTSAPTADNKLTYVYDEVRRQVVEVVGEERASTGGFRIFTSIDAALQKSVEETLRRRLTEVETRPGYEHQTYGQYHQQLKDWKDKLKAKVISPSTPKPKQDYLQGSALVMDNATGAVLAVVGGRDFLDSQFNRAFLASRATGTAFLPVFYASAFTKPNIFPGTAVRDTFIDNRFVMVGAIEGIAGEWGEETEQATTFKNRISLREAFTRSRIGSAVYLGRDLFGNGQTDKVDMPIDYGPLEQTAQKLGIASPLERLPASFLGKSGAKLGEMTLAYSAFANQGKRPPMLHVVNRITDFNDAPIYQISDADTELKQVIDPIAAYQVHSCLVDSLERGTGSAARSEFALGNFPAAGKTGTHYGFKDLWQIGYTSEVTCGVWVGFDNPKPIYGQAYANRIALPIWCDIVNATATTYKPTPFQQPQGLEQVEICRKSGARAGDFCYDKQVDPVTGKMVAVRDTCMELVSPGTLLDASYCTEHTGEGLALDIKAFRANIGESVSSSVALVGSSGIGVASIDPRFSRIQPVRMQSLTTIGIDPFESVQPVLPAQQGTSPTGTPVMRAEIQDDLPTTTEVPIKLAPPKPVRIE